MSTKTQSIELKGLVPLFVSEKLDAPPWIQLMDEEDLKDEVKPDSVLWQLRIRLWGLVEVVLQNQGAGLAVDPIPEKNLYRDICSRQMWAKRIQDEVKGAFICRPIYDFTHQLDALLTVGASRLWEIISIPIKDKRGHLIPASARLVLQAFKMLKDTKFGGPVQRVITAQVKSDPDAKNPVLIDDEIKMLEDKLRAGKVVDVGEI